jgi:hypothetical protein
MVAAKKTALVLRCCREDMSSQNGFVWPDVGGEAICPDWENNSECGNGLHGWLYGQGDHTTSSYWNDPKAKWLVVEVEKSGIFMLGGKCKFERGFVRFVGSKSEAAAYIIEHEPHAMGVAVIGAAFSVCDKQNVIVGALGTATAGALGNATAGDGGTATAGALGNATAGDGGTATAGYRGTATAGDGGTATAGALGNATAGDGGTATAGALGNATAGDGGTATAGYRGTATAGDGGTATAGYRGTATAGDGGTATAGALGNATAGALGELCIRYWDSKANRYRTAIAYVGEDGIEANVAYRLDDQHKFKKVA